MMYIYMYQKSVFGSLNLGTPVGGILVRLLQDIPPSTHQSTSKSMSKWRILKDIVRHKLIEGMGQQPFFYC